MPEVRLIDANALLKRLQEQQKYGSMQDSRGRAKAILEVIHAPTIEAEPVLLGQWVEVSRNISYPLDCDIAIKCSICGHHEIIPLFRKDNLRFCSYCGARMDLRTPTEVQLDKADSVMMGGADNG